MIIYVDVIFITNTLMTYALLWGVARLMEYKYKWWKLMLGALVGTAYTFIILLFQLQARPFWIRVSWHLLLNIISALLIIYVSFGPLSRKKFYRAVAYLYLVSFVTIGAILALINIYGINPFIGNRRVLFILISLLVLVIIGKNGWRILQNYITPEEFFLPVSIIIEEKEVELRGLVDTGNKLNDPLTGVPVMVVELEKLYPLLPESINEKITDKGGLIDLISILQEYGLGHRLRILPFSDLGQEHGMLVGLRPDQIILEYQGKPYLITKVILGLSSRKLDDEENYQALINPQLLQQENY